MRKRIRYRQLGRTSSHKWAMLRNMVTSLIEHERIVTTVAKAKEVQTLAEKVITMVKRNTPAGSGAAAAAALGSPLSPIDASSSSDGSSDKIPFTPQLFNAFRRVGEVVRTPQAIAKAVHVLGPRYHFREGGYTRILKLSQKRAGDNASMAVIEYVDRPGEIRAARPPAMVQEHAELWLQQMMEEDAAAVADATAGAGSSTMDAEMEEAGLEALEPLQQQQQQSPTTK